LEEVKRRRKWLENFAIHYIDTRSQNAVEELNKLGGAEVILATVPSGKAMSAVLGGLY
jgi:D-arabinose 1-dehydrogenase-like Zn-dependent alcohol dehydrogenase